MRRRTTVTLAAVAVAVILMATIAAYYHIQTSSPKTASPLPSSEPPNWQIKITGDVQQEKILTIKELSQMPLTNVTVKSDNENKTYWGVSLYDFCNRTGANWDIGPIEVVSADGSKATLSIFQAYNSSAYPYYYNNNVIILAFIQDKQWLGGESGGPVRLVTPYFSGEYQVENVAEINFKPWSVSVSGNVANPFVITKGNLTSYSSTTVYAEFAASEKRWSNWTGISILELLQYANASSRAETVTITAIDGYTKNYTLQQIQDGQMLLGYAENNQPMPYNQGGPFRLFAPTDQYKWAQFWVKFVVDIKVS